MIRIFFYHVQKKISVEEICEENSELSQEWEIAKTVDPETIETTIHKPLCIPFFSTVPQTLWFQILLRISCGWFRMQFSH